MVELASINNTRALEAEVLRRAKEHFADFGQAPTRVVVGSLEVARWLVKCDASSDGKRVLGLLIECGDGRRSPFSFVVC